MSEARIWTERPTQTRSFLPGPRSPFWDTAAREARMPSSSMKGGLDVRVGLRAGSSSARLVERAGIPLMSVNDAAREADLIAVLLPDTVQARVYREEIEPHLGSGDTLLFAHGFNVHYGEIRAPEGVDVIMVAPKSPGAMLYREASGGNGVPALIAVDQDASGTAHGVALAYAHAIGSTRAGVLETTFAEETETDLFGEQAVLCGGLTALIQNGFETLVEAGYQPELAYFECLHEMKLIVDLAYKAGLSGMRREISDTARVGRLCQRAAGRRGPQPRGHA